MLLVVPLIALCVELLRDVRTLVEYAWLSDETSDAGDPHQMTTQTRYSYTRTPGVTWGWGALTLGALLLPLTKLALVAQGHRLPGESIGKNARAAVLVTVLVTVVIVVVLDAYCMKYCLDDLNRRVSVTGSNRQVWTVIIILGGP
jgi:hypothetical protein